MNRDGARQSIWQATEGGYTARNAWNKGETYDVLIVGGGITGITTALLLQEAGKKCIIAEAHNLAFGTTGGTTAHLNTILDTPYHKLIKDFGEDDARLVALACREALDLIEGLVSRYSINCGFGYKPGYIFAQNDDEVEELNRIKEGNDKVNVMSEYSDVLPIPASFKKSLKVDFQAQLHATQYVHALARLFEDNGGVVLEHCLVDQVNENDSGVEADTSLGIIKAKQAVYATHLPPGINIFSFRCAPYRSYAMACTLKSGVHPDGLVYDLVDPYNYYRCQQVDGKEYLIAGGFDHKTGHNHNTEHVFTELEAHLRHIFDIDEIASSWSSQFYESADGLPYIGLMPGSDRIYVGTGYGGNGMTLGTIAAKIICGLITNNESPYQDVFDPSRIKMSAGFAKFVKEGADVVAQFVGKRFGIETLDALADLAPGDATIANWEGDKVAIYKDDNGHVYAVSPVCKHAGCIVTWNSAEKSWDCPCHGTRYAPNGDVLTGPATRDLEQIKWEDIEGD